MDSWAQQTATVSPQVKFENSPAESFLSVPGDMYPSLFESASSTPAASTMNPLDIMTPESYSEDQDADMDALTSLSMGLSNADAETPTPSGEKKTTKKRKSWGQVLPEPKTNLPPRKRAKTEDEKEQRRVERVLRNRRAAQSSRERKRLEVEALELRNKDLEAALLHAQKANFMLVEELNKFRRTSGVVTRTPGSLDALRPNPVTLSQELFSSQDGHSAILEQAESSIVDELMMSSHPNSTVNPASLSPELNPVSDEDLDETAEADATAATSASDAAAAIMASASSDLTQHPAEMLCDDLPCQSPDAPPWSAVAVSQRAPALALLLSTQLQLLMTSTSAALSVCQRPLTQIAMSLRAPFSLPPTLSILNTIIWLVTTPRRSRSPRRPTTARRSSTRSTSTNSSTTCPPTPSRRSSSSPSTAAASSPTRPPSSRTLRMTMLLKILTCSPHLARPLMDATMEALRLVSSEGRNVDRVSGGSGGSAAMAAVAGGEQQPRQLSGAGTPAVQHWPKGASAPSKEALLTLIWVLRVREQRIQARTAKAAPWGPGTTTSAVGTMTSPTRIEPSQ